MSDAVLVAIIGTIGTVIGSVTTVIVTRMATAKHAPRDDSKADLSPVLGEVIDSRELRILRALFGEPKGRYLEAYRDKYYKGSLDAVVRKGWVRLVANRYYLTPKGADFCRAYLTQTLKSWQPANPVPA